MTGITFCVIIATVSGTFRLTKLPNLGKFMIFDILIKTLVRVEMSDVCDETLKSIYGTFLFRTALKSQCLGYLGRKYQIKKYRKIQPFFPKRAYLDLWAWLDFWVFINN